MRFAGIMLCVVAGMGCRLIADYDFADGLHADHRDGGGGELVRHDAGSQDRSRRDRGRHDVVLHDTGPRDLLVDRGAGTLLFQV
ncbi:MAG: hypothetical protein KAI47_25055, partial [Deltaproteobacteria bacterium]|nr:hypothetical protein [Deltaproteobacteria bacterium]